MSNKRYHYATASEAVKIHTAQIGLGLKARGFAISTFLDILAETDYSPAARTLREHMSAVARRVSPFTAGKKSGAPPLLTAEEREIFCGWILLQNKAVDFAAIITWIKENFGKIVSNALLSIYLKEMGLSVQLVGKRHTKCLTHDEYCKGYFHYLVEVREEGFFEGDGSKIISFDFVTNSGRIDRNTTVQLVGQKQKRVETPPLHYTDSYLVPAAYKAGLGMKAMLFTHNPVFEENGRHWDTVLHWCGELRINPSRILYQASTGKYCKESKEQVSHFQAVYREKLLGCRIMHDAGNAFKLDGEYILADGADMHMVLPSEQHGELSVLDNKLNAVAKARWRRDRTGTDHDYDALLLLAKIDEVEQSSITSWYESNFLLGEEKLTPELVKKHLEKVKGKEILRSSLFLRYTDAYHMWNGAMLVD